MQSRVLFLSIYSSAGLGLKSWSSNRKSYPWPCSQRRRDSHGGICDAVWFCEEVPTLRRDLSVILHDIASQEIIISILIISSHLWISLLMNRPFVTYSSKGGLCILNAACVFECMCVSLYFWISVYLLLLTFELLNQSLRNLVSISYKLSLSQRHTS